MWFFLILFHLDVWKYEGGWSSRRGRESMSGVMTHLKISSWEALSSLVIDSKYSYANRREVHQLVFQKAAPASGKDDSPRGASGCDVPFQHFLTKTFKDNSFPETTLHSENSGIITYQYKIPIFRSLLIPSKNVVLVCLFCFVLLQTGFLGNDHYLQRKYTKKIAMDIIHLVHMLVSFILCIHWLCFSIRLIFVRKSKTSVTLKYFSHCKQ